MTGPPQDRASEAPRDQAESAFTPALRWLLRTLPDVLAAVFVDAEGECVDYCSVLEPFDAKVAGAHLLVIARMVREGVLKLGGGEPTFFEIEGSQRILLVRRLDDHYQLVVVLRPRAVDERVVEATERLAGALRDEAGLEAPSWDQERGSLDVETREAVGWPYAPAAFRQGKQVTRIAAVLGRWTEHGGLVGGELVCFRVRTEDGSEITLAHDVEQDRWLRW